MGLSILIGHASGHWNSNVNLARDRRLQDENGDSINAQWQCEPLNPPESTTVRDIKHEKYDVDLVLVRCPAWPKDFQA